MANTDSDNITIIQDLYTALPRGDVGALVAAMHEDIEWHEAEHSLWHEPGGYRGPGDVLSNVFARIPDHFDDFRVVPQRFHAAADTVIVEGRYQATVPTGGQLDAQVCHLWTIRDGKLSRFQQYTDTLQLAQVTRT